MRALGAWLGEPEGLFFGLALLGFVGGMTAGVGSMLADARREGHLRAMVAAGTDPMAARCALLGGDAARDDLCKALAARGGCGGQRVEAAR